MRFITLIFSLFLWACSTKTPPPKSAPSKPAPSYQMYDPRFNGEPQPHHQLHDDACALLNERPHWRLALNQVKKKWQIDAWYILAFMHQESRFNPKALSKSMAYGYPQAKDATWDWYQSKISRVDASRERFDDSADFIGWYAHQNVARNRVNLHDVRNQYLAYHEGLGGFEKQSYLAKAWLMEIADKVADRASFYQSQLLSCSHQ